MKGRTAMERQRPFQREGFTEEEADAVVRRAVELQQQADAAGRIPRRALEESAEVAGVAPEFVQQAITELQSQRATTAPRAAPAPAAHLRVAILAALIAMAISFWLSARLSYRGPSATVAPPPPAVAPIEVNPPPVPQPPPRPAPPLRR